MATKAKKQITDFVSNLTNIFENTLDTHESINFWHPINCACFLSLMCRSNYSTHKASPSLTSL